MAVQANDTKVFWGVVLVVTVYVVKFNWYWLAHPFRKSAYPTDMTFFPNQHFASGGISLGQYDARCFWVVYFFVDAHWAILVLRVNPNPFPTRTEFFLLYGLGCIYVSIGLENGAGTRIRTEDIPLTRRVLCHLSYSGLVFAVGFEPTFVLVRSQVPCPLGEANKFGSRGRDRTYT